MGNIIASGALLAWPVVTLVLFLTLSTPRAITASLLWAYLLLPYSVGFDFKGVPTLDKSSIPSITTLLLAFCLAPPGAFRWPKSPWFNLLLIVYVFCPILTTMTNPDALTVGEVTLPGLTFYDAFSASAEKAIEAMPLIAGAALLRSETAHRDVLLVFVVAALAYSAPILLEIARGPFLQARIYHVDPGTWYEQQIRAGGFRAIVFIGHGLLVSAFLGLAFLAALGLWRDKWRVMGLPAILCAVWLLVMLVLNKSAGALITGTALALLFVFLRPRRFIGIALVVAMMIVTYPVLRGNGFVPTAAIQSAISSVSSERAASLGFRLRNEDMLLHRANQRPWFGWGGYARNHVIVVTEWGETKDVTVTDGTWVIAIGTYGWIGYLSTFGLLCYPFWHLFRMRRRSAISMASVTLAAMLLFNLLDLIPNSSLRPITWLIAGALSGLTIMRAKQAPSIAPGAPGAADPIPAQAPA
ncbi:MAG: O-antigen ligase family protein [Sphingobium sp.]|nr:O-antigen ligase family protein [Sphingobium sp.]